MAGKLPERTCTGSGGRANGSLMTCKTPQWTRMLALTYMGICFNAECLYFMYIAMIWSINQLSVIFIFKYKQYPFSFSVIINVNATNKNGLMDVHGCLKQNSTDVISISGANLLVSPVFSLFLYKVHKGDVVLLPQFQWSLTGEKKTSNIKDNDQI